jgi:hypothetical protein
VAALLLVSMGAAADPASSTPAAELFAQAKQSFAAGAPDAALAALRALRARYPESSLALESLALSVEVSLSVGDDYLARSFLHRLRAETPGSAAGFRAALLIAEREYARRSYGAALEFYTQAVESAEGAQGAEGGSGAVDRRGFDRALLRAAEITLYHEKDPRGARSFFRRIQPRNLESVDRPLYTTMRVRLVWDSISAAELGLVDSNVSTLRVDGDDLWVGTWNGGVARWSVSSGQSAAFPSPAFARSIEVTDRRVWIAAADGLAWYGKATARWGFSDVWRGLAVAEAAGELYAGTLGDGLQRLAGEEWERVSDGELPGRFVTCIAGGPDGASVLVGTMTLGLIVIDVASGAMRGLDQIVPAFTARNVTSVLTDAEGRVWIGTYGEGLFLWTPGKGSVRRFSRETGEIGDDWVLAMCETPRALYFGTFGAGVSAFEKSRGAWRRFGIADGLASLDVTAIAARAPYVFFGTLGAGVSVYDEAADGAEF